MVNGEEEQSRKDSLVVAKSEEHVIEIWRSTRALLSSESIHQGYCTFKLPPKTSIGKGSYCTSLGTRLLESEAGRASGIL